MRAASDAVEEGLRIAKDCGFGIYHIDLLLVRAQLALHEGRADDALHDIAVALDEGVHPKPESGLPTMLAASDAECGYAWGIAEGRHLRGEALLLKAAQQLGASGFVPARIDDLPAAVRDLIDQARTELDAALKLWHDLRDPESEAEINPQGEKTQRVLQDLTGGVLSTYPLEPVRPPDLAESTAPADASEASEPAESEGAGEMPKKHVFLSYCRDNEKEVSQLRDDLIAAGEQVWWDRDILPGHDWKMSIRQAMKDSYAVVLCLSKEAEARATSGIFPEALDAIAAYREYAPGSIFLIPVRLSKSNIPPFPIDAVRTLDSLQYVDLFPPAKRGEGLQRLVKAIQAAPLHP